METISKTNNGEDILSSPLLNQLRKKNPVLYGQYRGWLFRSTMSIKKKISLLENFLARGDLSELPSLIQSFKEHYQLEFISRRNSEWREFYGF